MSISRRNFLKLSAMSAFGAVACNFFPEDEFVSQSPVRLPEDLVTGTDNWYATLCKQCSETEGLVVRVMEGRAKKIQGNPFYPTNQGGHSPRCEAALQALYHPDRISKPLLMNTQTKTYDPIDWDTALDILKEKFQTTPSQKTMIITRPLRGNLARLVDVFSKTYECRQLAFEALDDTNFKIVMESMLGQGSLPTFDLQNSEYLISFGSDFLSTWTSPVQYARNYGDFRQGVGRTRGTFVQVDPRFSMTASNADEWIPIKGGNEGKMALSIAYVIMSEGLADDNRIKSLTGGEGPEILEQFAPDKIAVEIGIPPGLRDKTRTPEDVIRDLAHDFAKHGSKSLAIGGGSAGAHKNGLFNLHAIYSLNYLVGSVGQKGGIISSSLPPLDELRTKLPIGTLGEWGNVSSDIGNGEIELLLVHEANPIQGLPSSIKLQENIASGNTFVISFSSFQDETTALSNLILPIPLPLEDWGDDVPDPGPGHDIVGIQQPIVRPLRNLDVPYGFADLLLIISQELGIDTQAPLDKESFKEILRESARKLHDLNRGSVIEPDFDTFWNRLLQQGGWWDRIAIGPDINRDPPNLKDLLQSDDTVMEPEITGPEGENTFHLIPFQSISLMDGRGAHLPWLQATPDPITTVTWTTWIEMNTSDAERMGLKEGDIVTVEGLEGELLELPVYHHPAVPPGTVSIPIGQSNTSGISYAKDKGENLINRLPAITDAKTGAFAWASNRVRIVSSGRSTKLSKFEGIVPAYPTSAHEAVVKVTRG